MIKLTDKYGGDVYVAADRVTMFEPKLVITNKGEARDGTQIRTDFGYVLEVIENVETVLEAMAGGKE